VNGHYADVPLKRKAILFGFSLAASCAGLTLLTVWSSHGLTAAAVAVIVFIWAVTGAFSGAAYYQQEARKTST
jgi:hypothetical protein